MKQGDPCRRLQKEPSALVTQMCTRTHHHSLLYVTREMSRIAKAYHPNVEAQTVTACGADTHDSRRSNGWDGYRLPSLHTTVYRRDAGRNYQSLNQNTHLLLNYH